MKKILVCLAAVAAFGVVACGKDAKVSVCEKMIDCAGTGDKASCSKTASADAGTTATKCTAEADAAASCLDSKGKCDTTTKVYSAGTACDSEVAAYITCYAKP